MLRCPGVTLFGKTCGHGAVGDPIKNEKIKLGNPHVCSSPRQLLDRFLPQGGAAACGARESLESETPPRAALRPATQPALAALRCPLRGARARAPSRGRKKLLAASAPAAQPAVSAGRAARPA